MRLCAAHLFRHHAVPFTGWQVVAESFTLKKLECSKQACAMNTLAWNNNYRTAGSILLVSRIGSND